MAGQARRAPPMEQALAWPGDGAPEQLGVIHFNERAIAFYKKLGFEDTGWIVGRNQTAAVDGAAGTKVIVPLWKVRG